MTAAIHKLFQGLDRQLHPLRSEDEVAASMPTPEPKMLSDELAWLDRYLFDREWRWRHLTDPHEDDVNDPAIAARTEEAFERERAGSSRCCACSPNTSLPSIGRESTRRLVDVLAWHRR